MKALPNLASRPFVNTRPVVLAIAGALLVGLVMMTLNLRLFLSTSGVSAELTSRIDELEQRRDGLISVIDGDLEALDEVSWRTLRSDVEAANLVLQAHAFSWGRLLTQLEQTLPYAVRLVRVSPSVDKEQQVNVKLSGVAQSRDAMLDFLANLIASSAFDNVKPSGEVLPEGAASAGYEFELGVVYVPGERSTTAVEVSTAQRTTGEPAVGEREAASPGLPPPGGTVAGGDGPEAVGTP